jgi:hypothetical protein
MIGRRPAGNISVAATIILTGNSYSKMHAFANCLGLQFLSRDTCNVYQKEAVYPVIQEAWREEKARMTALVGEKPVFLSGDGRCDSPGHCARYGCYTFMVTSSDDDRIEGKIIECQLTDIAEEGIKNSQHLEPEGMRRGLDNLLYTDGINVAILTTDRHVTISSILKKEYDFICHQFDIWHLVKSVQKKLTAACRSKGGEGLQAWRQSVTNHLWWSASTCEGKEQLLREKWFSILQHIQNRHEWTGCEFFHKCCHERLSRRDQKDVMWLKPDSAAFHTLQKIVTDKNLLKAFPQITEFCHTGSLEIFHSMMLKYCPKRQHFPHAGMKARYYLAALDWNLQDHVRRVPESPSDIAVVYSKRRGEFVVRMKNRRDRKEATSEMSAQLLEKVIDLYINKREVDQMETPSNLRPRIAKQQKPDTVEQFSTYRTRFSKKD